MTSLQHICIIIIITKDSSDRRVPAGAQPALYLGSPVTDELTLYLKHNKSKNSATAALSAYVRKAPQPALRLGVLLRWRQTNEIGCWLAHEPSEAFWPPHAERFEATSDTYNGCVFTAATRELSKCARAKQEQRRTHLGVVHEARAKALDLLVGCDRAERDLTKALHSDRTAVSRCGCDVATSSLWLGEGAPGTRLRM